MMKFIRQYETIIIITLGLIGTFGIFLLEPAIVQLYLSMFLFFGAFISILTRKSIGYKKINYIFGILSMIIGFYLFFNFKDSKRESEIISVLVRNECNIFSNDSLIVDISNGLVVMGYGKYKEIYRYDPNELRIGDTLEIRHVFLHDLFGNKVNTNKCIKSNVSDSIINLNYIK